MIITIWINKVLKSAMIKKINCLGENSTDKYSYIKNQNTEIGFLNKKINCLGKGSTDKYNYLEEQDAEVDLTKKRKCAGKDSADKYNYMKK